MNQGERICPRCGNVYSAPRKGHKRTITEKLREMKEIDRVNDEHVRRFLEKQKHRDEE